MVTSIMKKKQKEEAEVESDKAGCRCGISAVLLQSPHLLTQNLTHMGSK